MRTHFIALLLLTISFLAPLASARVNVARVPICPKAPGIDGVFSEGEWDQATVLGNYSSCGEKYSSRPVTTLAMYDDDYLYIGFQTYVDFDPSFTPVPHDDVHIFTVDSFSMNFKHIGTNLNRQFVVERANGTLDRTWDFQTQVQTPEWEPSWKVKGKLTPGAFLTEYTWIVEAAIPWTALELTPRPGLEFGAQFVHYKGNGTEYSDRAICWTPFTSLWGLFGFGGDFILADKDWPCFRFKSYEGFGKGFINVKGDFVGGDMDGSLYLDLTCPAMTPQTRSENVSVKGNTLDYRMDFDIAAASDGMVNWMITDAHGQIAGARLAFPLQSAFNVALKPNYYEEKVMVAGDLRQIDELPQNADIICCLMDEHKAVLDECQFKLESPVFEKWLSFAKAPKESKITAVAKMEKNGTILFENSTKIPVLKRPEWLDFDGGTVTAPPANSGWSPVQIDGNASERIFRISKNEGRLGLKSPLPASLNINGQDFSAAAFTFVVETAAGVQEFQAKEVKLAQEDGRGATFQWDGSSQDGLDLSAVIRIEFDGLLWYKVQLKGQTDIRRIALRMPIQPDAIRYVRGEELGAYVAKAKFTHSIADPVIPYNWKISGQGWKAPKSFISCYWLGDDKGGMFVIFPSKRNIRISNSEYSSATDTDDRFCFDVNLVNEPTALNGTLDYEFGLMLSPTRTPKNIKSLWCTGFYNDALVNGENGQLVFDKSKFKKEMGDRQAMPGWDKPMARGYVENFLIQSYPIQCSYIYPSDDVFQQIANDNKRITGLGAHAILWCDTLFSGYLTEEPMKPYTDLIERHPSLRMQVEMYGTYVCPSRAWQNCYLHRAADYVRRGFRSFYMDLSSISPCSNRLHHHGWYDENGDCQQESPFLEAREFFLRLQNIIKSNDPDAILFCHGGHSTPMILWMDLMTFGEEWSLADDYSTLSMEYYQMFHASRFNMGVPNNFFPALNTWYYPKTYKTDLNIEEIMGMTFVHGEGIANTVDTGFGAYRLAVDAHLRFGAEDAEWIPYWRNPRNLHPAGVVVSSYQKENRELLLIFNPAYEQKELPASIFEGLHDLKDEMGNAEPELKTIKSRGFIIVSGQK